MKTLAELFELVAVAVERGQEGYGHWFIDYSGHVNKLSIRYHVTGWSKDSVADEVNFYLTEEGIQGAYWFIKSKLK